MKCLFKEQSLMRETGYTGWKDRHSSYPVGGPCSVRISETCRSRLHTIGIVHVLKVKGGIWNSGEQTVRGGQDGPTALTFVGLC